MGNLENFSIYKAQWIDAPNKAVDILTLLIGVVLLDWIMIDMDIFSEM